MNASSDKSSDKKSAKAGVSLPTGATDLRARVPGMTDDALVTLQANARRMAEAGNAAQRSAAGDLLPVIESELADRKAKKLAAQPARKAGAKRKAKAPTEDVGD